MTGVQIVSTVKKVFVLTAGPFSVTQSSSPFAELAVSVCTRTGSQNRRPCSLHLPKELFPGCPRAPVSPTCQHGGWDSVASVTVAGGLLPAALAVAPGVGCGSPALTVGTARAARGRWPHPASALPFLMALLLLLLILLIELVTLGSCFQTLTWDLCNFIFNDSDRMNLLCLKTTDLGLELPGCP